MKVWSWTAIGVLPVSLVLGSFHWGGKTAPARKFAPIRVASVTPQPLPKSPWRVSSTRSPVDAIDTTYISRGDQTSGGVVLGCNGNRLDVYVGSRNQEAFDGVNHQIVEMRFGDQPAFKQSWTTSQTSDGLFAPAPLLLVRSLLKQKRLAIEYKVNGKQETDVFEADDLELQLQENCPAYASSIRRAEKAAQLQASTAKARTDSLNPKPETAVENPPPALCQ